MIECYGQHFVSIREALKIFPILKYPTLCRWITKEKVRLLDKQVLCDAIQSSTDIKLSVDVLSTRAYISLISLEERLNIVNIHSEEDDS